MFWRQIHNYILLNYENKWEIKILYISIVVKYYDFQVNVSWSTNNKVELNLNKYMNIYISPTLISCTNSVSMYTEYNEPNQQHTAIYYNSWLRESAINFRF
jgi:hypothetical protein